MGLRLPIPYLAGPALLFPRAEHHGGRMTTKTVLHNGIGGRAVAPVDGRYSDLIDPSTGDVFASAPVSDSQDVDDAMRAAGDAFEKWRDTTPAERQRALLKFADAIEARADE